MTVGLPPDTDATEITGIEPLPKDVPSLPDILLKMQRIVDNWKIEYRNCIGPDEDYRVLRGDVNSARCRVRDAYNMCVIEKDFNKHRKKLDINDRYKTDPDLVAGYIKIAIEEFLSRAFERFKSERNSMCSKLFSELKDIEEDLEKHKQAAENGVVYEGPSPESIL